MCVKYWGVYLLWYVMGSVRDFLWGLKERNEGKDSASGLTVPCQNETHA